MATTIILLGVGDLGQQADTVDKVTEAVAEKREEKTLASAFDLPFTPVSISNNQLRYASTLIEPYDMALLHADYIKAAFGLAVDELPHYSRMVRESRSCVYDFEDGIRLIVVPEVWPVPGVENCTNSVIRASGYDHPAVVAENSTWGPDGVFATKIGRRFSQLTGVPVDRLMFVGLTPLGLPCWVVEQGRETVQ